VSAVREKKNAQQRDWRRRNLTKAREIGRRSYRANHETNLSRSREYQRENRDVINAKKRAAYAALTPEERWDSKLRRTYGITADDYAAMLTAQGGVCAVCRQPERAGRDGRIVRLSVDHCHRTGAVRGLLCRACNTRVGIYEGRHVDDIRRYLSTFEEA